MAKATGMGRGLAAILSVSDAEPGEERTELRDVAVGETVLLLNYTHQPADTPYRASHAIFVREGATRAAEFVDEVPELLRRRPISLRAFDARNMMVDAELVDGCELGNAIETLFSVSIRPDSAPVWHEDVRFFRIERNGALIGQFYLDLYAREEKKGGAWMDSAITRRRIPGGIETPVA